MKERIIEDESNMKLKKEQEAEARGGVLISDEQMDFLMLWGCSPATGVKSDTSMVYDISKIFFEKLDLVTMSLTIP